MNPLRVLTVDDELLALKRLKLLLQTIPHVEHVGEASNCGEALARSTSFAPTSCCSISRCATAAASTSSRPLPNAPIRRRSSSSPHSTSLRAQAFDSAVVDYLLKPVERTAWPARFPALEQRLKAVDAEQRVDELHQILRNLRLGPASEGDPAYETEFWLRNSSGLVRVPVDAIDCVSSADEYVSIHTPSGSHLMRGSIRQFDAPGRARPVRQGPSPLAGQAKRDRGAFDAADRQGGSRAPQRHAPPGRPGPYETSARPGALQRRAVSGLSCSQ